MKAAVTQKYLQALPGLFSGPNAVRSINRLIGGVTNYSYDNNGNMLSGDGRTMSYNAFNKPLSITRNGVTSNFSYGASLLRYKQIKTGLSGGTQTTYHVDRSLEIEKQGTRTTYRHYIDGIAILNREDIGASTTWKLGFNLKDRLGSVVTLADDGGTVLEHRSYDPFGKPRQGDFIDAGTIQAAIAGDPHPEFTLDPLTDRGFTDHEHLDEQRIIHMNGRAYDYDIGRFTSVDPFIQAPGFSQSINPYSYIMNNPLSGVDPSGYESHPPEEKVVPTTGSRLKTETKSSDGNGNSVTADRSGRITGMTGKVTIKDGVITLGGNDKNKVDLMFEGSIPWKGVPDGGVFGPNSRAQNGGSQTDQFDRYAVSDEDYDVLRKAISLVDERVKRDRENWELGVIIEGSFGGELTFDNCQDCVNPMIPEGVRIDGMSLAVGYDYVPIRNVPAIVISGPSFRGGTRRGWIEYQQEFIVKNTGMGRWTELSVRTGAVVIVHSPYDDANLVYQGTRDVQEFRRK